MQRRDQLLLIVIVGLAIGVYVASSAADPGGVQWLLAIGLFSAILYLMSRRSGRR